MTKIFEDIFYYRHPLGANANVYAFKDGPDIDLIDTGISRLRIVEGVWRGMLKDGIEPTHVRRIYHPHYHFDHVQADGVFLRRATRHKGNIPVFVPEPDLFRATPGFSLIDWNRQALVRAFPKAPLNQFEGIQRIGKLVLEPLVGSTPAPSIVPLTNGQTVVLGQRTAKVYITGGHTEGHAFFYFDDEDKILYTGDHDAMNEFTCDWGNMLDSVRLAQRLSPDNVFIGHNPVRRGKAKAMDFLNHYFDQFQKIFTPMIRLFRKDKVVDLTRIAYAMMGWLRHVKPVVMWAHMGLFSICKYLGGFGLGRLMLKPDAHMVFVIEGDPEKVDLIRLIIEGPQAVGLLPTK